MNGPSDPAVRYVSAVGFPGYLFGDDGTAWSNRDWSVRGTDEWTQIGLSKRHYGTVTLVGPTRKLSISLHRLLLILFVGPCPAGYQGCHLDENKFNNRLDNLAWRPREENHRQSANRRRINRQRGTNAVALIPELIAKAQRPVAARPHDPASRLCNLEKEPTMPAGTAPTQIRLTESDKAKIEQIRERFGLPSMAAAIRYAVDRLHRDTESPKRGRR